MPTYGWIYEEGEDRFHERGGGGLRPPPIPHCPICGEQFGDGSSLSWHVSTTHPVERPLLLLQGSPMASLVRVRSVMAPGDVVAVNCTDVLSSVNGRPEIAVVPEQIGLHLGGDDDAEHRLRLFNRRAEDEAKIEAAYSLRITIPDPDELTTVDERFVDHLAVDDLSMELVDRFVHETRSLRSARYYINALVEYSVGLLIKEGTGAGGAALPFAKFQGKLAGALSELALFPERPVALAVSTCARLNLNEFVDNPASGIVALDECHRFFSTLRMDGEPAFPRSTNLGPGTVPICPVDRDTHLVLQSLAVLGDSAVDGPEILQIEEQASDGRLSGFDRAKLAALAAARRSLGGDDSGAKPLLRMLAHDPQLGSWARQQLGEEQTNE